MGQHWRRRANAVAATAFEATGRSEVRVGLPVILPCKETGAERHCSSLPYESASVQGLEWALEPPLRSLFSTRLNTFIATREEEGPFMMTNSCRTATPRERHEQPAG